LRSVNLPRNQALKILSLNHVLSPVKVFSGVELLLESIDHKPAQSTVLTLRVNIPEIAEALLSSLPPSATSVDEEVIDAQIEIVARVTKTLSDLWVAKALCHSLQLPANQPEGGNASHQI
jgi:hypothetical protein